MTDKKEQILAVALQLFANQGYASTPTSQIAKEAQVSEGLIFRHFGNKEGLLLAVLEKGQVRVEKLVEAIRQESSPKRVIALTIELPVTLIEQEREFWTLQFALKYQNQRFAALKKQNVALQLLVTAVQQALEQLGYAEPLEEAQLLMLLLEGLSSSLLTQEQADSTSLIAVVKAKYGV